LQRILRAAQLLNGRFADLKRQRDESISRLALEAGKLGA
jgi:hypothetical protein